VLDQPSPHPYNFVVKFLLKKKRSFLITLKYSYKPKVKSLLSTALMHMGKWRYKAIPLQALTGPEGSRRLRLPHFKTIGT
jgi:hypothetical protein